jgi:hypothetical protein
MSLHGVYLIEREIIETILNVPPIKGKNYPQNFPTHKKWKLPLKGRIMSPIK